ncbi:MAG: DNRLRE domain-containing protein [Phycisphaerales bacterium]|nr:MAG: DNRLRE domain-containing protein [Phycisphaerales bacterium]
MRMDSLRYREAKLVVAVCVVMGLGSVGLAAEVVLNEYNAVQSDRWLDCDGMDCCCEPDPPPCDPLCAGDVFFGRIEGNGKDWFELVVIQDHLDVQGWELEWTDNNGESGTLTLTADPLWSDLRAGTIITFAESDTARGCLDTDVSYDPSDPFAGDWWIHINTLVGEIVCVGGIDDGQECVGPNVCNGGDNAGLACDDGGDCPGGTCDPTTECPGGTCVDSEVPQEQYVTTVTTSGSGPGHFSVNNDDWQLTIRDDLDAVIFGPSGEGVPASGPGVGSREVFKLEEDPSDSIDPVTSNYNDGTSSSFGMPNLWSGGTMTQDFRGLRGAPVLESVSPPRGSLIGTLPTVSVTFTEAISGLVAGDLTVDGSPATSVTGAGEGPYEFSGFVQPTEGLVTIILASAAIADGDGNAFPGDTWQYTFEFPGIVINEIHYHPADTAVGVGEDPEDLQFLELYNGDASTADLSDWSISDGVDFTFPEGTTLDPGAYLLVVKDAVFLQATIGTIPVGVQVLQWVDGNLRNSGERLAISDSLGNVIDEVTFDDGGSWPGAADGDGPSLELRNPALPNELGAAWRASLGTNGTPGELNSIFEVNPTPLIAFTAHSPVLPGVGEAITITATVVDDTPGPAVTLYYRQDQDASVAYSSVPMLDDGLSGDGAAGDDVYGAVVAGLAEGQRLDFTIRADDGSGVSAAPPGHDTDVLNGANTYPSQTYLCKFSDGVPPDDSPWSHPWYHLITTQRTRNLQVAHNKTEYDATFIQCDASGNNCKLFYNVVERYRGASSINQHPHSFRIDFNADQLLQSGMGFEITALNLMSQQPNRQILGMSMFEAMGDPTPMTQAVRLNTNPLSHGGTQDWAYANVERINEEFFESQGGAITPARYPDRCSTSQSICDSDIDCPGGETCVATTGGNCYRGRHDYNARLVWLGFDPSSYMVNSSERNGYQLITNEEDHDWTDLINLCDALWCSTSDGGLLCTEDNYVGWYPDHLEDYGDVTQWTRWFAMHNLIVNTEGGIYRDTGDDYFLYFHPSMDNATFLPWDMDAFFGSDYNQTIWRTEVDSVERVLEHNAFAGRFVGAVCELMETVFTQESMDAMIDAIPDATVEQPGALGPQGGGPTSKQGMKDWVAARRTSVYNQITSQTTLDGVPASPYTDPDPVIALSGDLNQCWAHDVLINGQPVDYFSVYNAEWSDSHVLTPGVNHILLQCLDHEGVEVDRIEQTVIYSPPGGNLRLTMPTRMLNDKTLTLKAEMLDQFGNIDWREWNILGTVSARRVSDQSAVPTTVNVFETFPAGAGQTTPDDSIRFYNGVGSVSLVIDDPGSVVGEDIEIVVTVGGRTASKVVSVLDSATVATKSLSGALSAGDLTWGPGDGVIHLTGTVTVPSGSTLTIQAGTLIMVDAGPGGNGTAIECNSSTVDAQGSEAEPVFFFPTNGFAAMVLPQSTNNNPSSWRGFRHAGTGTSTYSWVFITGAGNGPVTGHPRPAVFWMGDAHSVTLSDCVAADSPGKIMHGLGSGVYTVLRNLWSRAGIGAEVLGGNHTFLVEDSWFTRIGRAQEDYDVDGDIFHLDNPSSNQMIRRSILTDCGDDMMDHSGANPVVEDCIIYDADDKCVSLSGGGSITFNNVLVFGMPLGINGAGGIVTHSTINTWNNAMGTPISVQNSILWPRSIDTCDGDTDYTLIGDPAGLGCGDGNFSSDPLFIDPWSGAGDYYDYNLQPGSLAANAGQIGERIGWLGFPDGSSCVVDGDCDDGNACTVDTCNLGACAFAPIAGCVPCQTSADCDDGNPCTVETCELDETCSYAGGNEGASCNDGWSCTIDDECSGGVCAGTESCPPGQSCNVSGDCEAGPTTLTFRDGVGSYDGTHDTFLREAAPDSINGSMDNWEWDLEDPAPNQNVGLIRFDDIIGTGAGQIPEGADITSATLTLVAFDPSEVPAGDVNECLVSWDQATATWNNFGGEAGVQADEIGGFAASAPINSGTAVIDVTANMQAWAANPAANLGWVFLPHSYNGLQIRSSEYAAINERPLLTVDFAGAGCTVPADCNDGNQCTDDDCVSEVCVNDPIPGCCLSDPDCDDSDPCTTDTCNTGTNTCEYVNNTDLCDDGDACTTSDTCSGGICVGGPAPDCDDVNVCTNDTCDSVLGCVNAPNAYPCDDQVACTGNDTCSGGVCIGQDSCSGNQTCNLLTGECEAQVTFEFQDGLNGYSGTHDTYLQEDAPAAINGALESLEWDGADGTSQTPNYTLLRFDDLFDDTGGPIAVGSTIESATLTYTVGGDQSPVGDGGRLHLIDTAVFWDEASVNFNNFGGDVGVQAGEYDVGYEAALGTPEGPVSIDVTGAVQAWAPDPSSNVGWIIIPQDNDGVQIRSSEYLTGPTERPKLTVIVTSGAVAEPPTIEAVGSRYLSVTPAPEQSSVALRIENSSLPCFPRYVDAGGYLVDTPVFQSSTQWGTVHVGDQDIIPDTMYEVRADVRLVTEPENLSDAVSATTWQWGNADNFGDVDLFDITCVVDGWQDVYTRCTLYGNDLRGDVPDRDIDLFDIVAVVDGWQNIPYNGAAPCTQPRHSTGIAGVGASDTPTATISLIPASQWVRPGELVSIDVYVSGVPDLRGYEVGLDALGGTWGELSLESIEIDEDFDDYVFGGSMSFSGIALNTGRMACAAVDPVSAMEPAYLGTYYFRVQKRAFGTFQVVVRLGADTNLAGSLGEPISPVIGQGADISVITDSKPRRRRSNR